MPSRAACAGSGVPAPWPRRGQGAKRRCSPATSSHPNVPRVRWSPSPCGRLSRPRSTTAPLPRPGGDSGRCACPGPQGPAGTAGTLPTFTINRLAGPAPSYTPAASPRGTATRHAASPARWVSGRTRRPPSVRKARAPQQPIAASFGAGDESRGFNHWFGLPAPFCLACMPGPLAAGRHYVVGAAPALALTSGLGLPPASTGRRGGRRWVSHPTRFDGASWRTAELVEHDQLGARVAADDPGQLPARLGLLELVGEPGRGGEAHPPPLLAGADRQGRRQDASMSVKSRVRVCGCGGVRMSG
jgi:hypothetical protein